MELPHGTHKQTTYGWLLILQEMLAARAERRAAAEAALRGDVVRTEQPPSAGLVNLAAPH